MGAWRLGGTLALALALRTASAQPVDAPVDVSVDDLLQIEGVASLSNRSVRTKGTLEMSNRLQGQRFGFALRGRFGGQVEIVPVGEVSYEFETDAKRWFGQEVEITGVVSESTDARGHLVLIQFWKYFGPPDRDVN